LVSPFPPSLLQVWKNAEKEEQQGLLQGTVQHPAFSYPSPACISFPAGHCLLLYRGPTGALNGGTSSLCHLGSNSGTQPYTPASSLFFNLCFTVSVPVCFCPAAPKRHKPNMPPPSECKPPTVLDKNHIPAAGSDTGP
jgi:hypothetical protein